MRTREVKISFKSSSTFEGDGLFRMLSTALTLLCSRRDHLLPNSTPHVGKGNPKTALGAAASTDAAVNVSLSCGLHKDISRGGIGSTFRASAAFKIVFPSP
ncbi:hypothetical protein PsorP6_015387 [Peronosclerospora sorghi]|uniref:Uncharacterized protein n=1 Tax=Peronosclerospora sorghi TaxID=230839 RepID=A0ACC0WNX4_9STRA|nr:hypothetical protein PsorP6_015387 [Peronosclerospora sorghi]